MSTPPTSKAELAYIALANLLTTVVGVATNTGTTWPWIGGVSVSRKLIDPSQMNWTDTPAIFVNETGENIVTTKGFEGVTAAKQELNADLYLYVTQGVQEAVCSTKLNDMIQSIRTAIAPSAGQTTQELNGTVSHCWISGKIEIIEGVLDGQGVAILPVSILTNI
jgi:hypothetical protein